MQFHQDRILAFLPPAHKYDILYLWSIRDDYIECSSHHRLLVTVLSPMHTLGRLLECGGIPRSKVSANISNILRSCRTGESQFRDDSTLARRETVTNLLLVYCDGLCCPHPTHPLWKIQAMEDPSNRNAPTTYHRHHHRRWNRSSGLFSARHNSSPIRSRPRLHLFPRRNGHFLGLRVERCYHGLESPVSQGLLVQTCQRFVKRNRAYKLRSLVFAWEESPPR